MSAIKNEAKSIFNSKRQLHRFLFWLSIVVLPLIQFCVFYVYVNFNMIVMSFQHFEAKTDALGYVVNFAGLENFKAAWQFLGANLYMIKNSLIYFVFCTLLTMAFSLCFSFYIYKQFFASKFFKVMLFMPQIVSSVVFALLFKYIVTDVYIGIVGGENVIGLLDNPATRFGTVLFYNVWMGFGVSILLFSGAMSGINESIVESAEIDGATHLREFVSITIPMIFPTIKSLLILGIVGVFTNQMNLYTLFDNQAGDVSTLGYSIYLQSVRADIINKDPNNLDFSQLSALGLILTLILVPITAGIKKLLDKYGASV